MALPWMRMVGIVVGTLVGLAALGVRGETPRRTEIGDVPADQGATREQIKPFVTEKQRRAAGYSVDRMQRGFHHGLLEGAALGQSQDGLTIASDPALFSSRFRVEFREMNETFGDFGFEIEVIDGERPTLAAIRAAYGDPHRADDVEVVLESGGRETRVTLRFHYYGDVGFGVRPDDSDGIVLRVKRREG